MSLVDGTGNVFAVSAANVDPDRMTKAHSQTMTHLARHNSPDAAATSTHQNNGDAPAADAAEGAAAAVGAVRKVKRPIGQSKHEGRVVTCTRFYLARSPLSAHLYMAR